MATNVRETIKGLSPARRKKIEARAAALIAEEMSLRDLRQALTLTQERMAETLGIGQDGVSRLDNAAICSCRLCGPTSKPWAVSSH
jgi:DNA-binding transcriptional regulator YiaG